MKRFAFITVFVTAALPFVLMLPVFSQSTTSSWAFFVELTPGIETPGMYELIVPLEVMDKSREDLADLRLHDAHGREIPYAIRIRSDVDNRQEVGGTLFNQANVGSLASEVSVDLGDDSSEHNELEVETSGTNFRRRVTVEGSDSGADWKILQTGALIFNFESQNRTVRSDRVSYPASRYRFLRVRVFADELTDKGPPTITKVSAVRAVRAKGELTTWHVNPTGYQLLRHQGIPASAWNIDLGARVPCDRIILDIHNASFSRPFQIEAGDDSESLRLVASGELTRHVGEEDKPLVILFDQEQQVRRLRLLINDYSNQSLTITAIQAGAPARQLVFELRERAAEPVRLYFGNPNATAPRYDFEKELAARLSAAPVGSGSTPPRITPERIGLGQLVNNPDYTPELLPLTERIPWLIYLVLALSSLALGFILFSLSRSTVSEKKDTEAA